MAKKILKKAPLIYVQLEMSWSPVPNPRVFTEEQLGNFRRAMQKLGFVDNVSLEQPMQGVSFTPLGAAVDSTNWVRHLSTFGDKSCQVEVNQRQLVIRQSHYEGFESLLRLAMQVFAALEPVEEIQETGVDVISLHYVDMFIPSTGNELRKYVRKSEIVPMQLDIREKVLASSLTNRTVALLQRSEERVRDIASQFQVLRRDNERFPLFIPVELQELQPEAAMSLKVPQVPDSDSNGDYGLLDIRHGLRLLHRPKLKKVDKESEIRALYMTANDVFWDMLSPHAKEEWQMEETHD